MEDALPPDRRPFRREPEAARREAMVAATLDLVAAGGTGAATVRAIAARAGVTAGLIRHYFGGKDDLIRTAYRAHMDGMTEDALTAAGEDAGKPLHRLAVFIAATLSPPVTDGPSVGRWAGFLHTAMSDPQLRETHEAGYLGFRDVLQGLIAALPRPRDAAGLRADAIACNAVIDGLWLEGSVIPGSFAPGEIVANGLRAVGAILGVDLPAVAPPAVLRPPPSPQPAPQPPRPASEEGNPS